VRWALAALVACGPAVVAVAPAPAPPPAKFVQINEPGAPVNIERGLVPGYVTVVDFWMESCGACKIVGKQLEDGVAREPQILIRKVDIGDAFTPVAEAYSISALPHYRIFDKRGHLRYQLVGPDCTKASELAKQLAVEP
jgi:thiol-disulfide isomerase/thioredoxin